MDDVIFAGTAKRAALGRAEVSLTIDNTAGLLPDRLHRGDHHPHPVPQRRLRVPASTGCRAGCSTSRSCCPTAGSGASSTSSCRQGQIDAVLNARPEERRLIIEEAAGVLKFRRRKEKGRAAPGRPPRRTSPGCRTCCARCGASSAPSSARPTRRAGTALVDELTALQVHVAGRELAALRVKLGSGAQERTRLGDEEAALRKRLAELDTSVMQTETELTAMGGDGLGDLLGRCEALRERSRGLATLLAERRRGLERTGRRGPSEGSIANLEAEAARLAADLEAVESEAAQMVPLGEAPGRGRGRAGHAAGGVRGAVGVGGARPLG